MYIYELHHFQADETHHPSPQGLIVKGGDRQGKTHTIITVLLVSICYLYL